MQGEFAGLARVEHAVRLQLAVEPSSNSQRAAPSIRAATPVFEQQMADLRIIAGTPKIVVAKLKRILQETRPGILALWAITAASARWIH